MCAYTERRGHFGFSTFYMKFHDIYATFFFFSYSLHLHIGFARYETHTRFPFACISTQSHMNYVSHSCHRRRRSPDDFLSLSLLFRFSFFNIVIFFFFIRNCEPINVHTKTDGRIRRRDTSFVSRRLVLRFTVYDEKNNELKCAHTHKLAATTAAAATAAAAAALWKWWLCVWDSFPNIRCGVRGTGSCVCVSA